jgi:hypothetical protein
MCWRDELSNEEWLRNYRMEQQWREAIRKTKPQSSGEKEGKLEQDTAVEPGSKPSAASSQPSKQ